MRFEFVVRSGKEMGRTVAVNSGQAISLGRLKGCDVVLDDEAASRRHCTIAAREDTCVVSDLQSANGTFVNEKRIVTEEIRKGEAALREKGLVQVQDNVKILTSCPSCMMGLNRYRDDLSNGLLEADYIVVEMARKILGEDWMPTYVARANSGGIERVLV